MQRNRIKLLKLKFKLWRLRRLFRRERKYIVGEAGEQIEKGDAVYFKNRK